MLSGISLEDSLRLLLLVVLHTIKTTKQAFVRVQLAEIVPRRLGPMKKEEEIQR